MRIALISDIHSNLHALQAVLDHIDEQGVDEVHSLGDVVGYNAFPSECTKLVRERAKVSILGNHDWAATTGDVDGFNEVAKAGVEHTRASLDEDDLEYLTSLKPSSHSSLPHVELDLHHASPSDPLREYVFPSLGHDLFIELSEALTADSPRVVALGHTHVPMIFSSHALPEAMLGELPTVLSEEAILPERDRALVLVNPGSVGQPRDGDPRAAYAVLDTEEVVVTFQRVEYDIVAAARAIRDAGLPELLGNRLGVGR